MPLADSPVAEGIPGPRQKTAMGVYDFALDGGAISTIGLIGGTPTSGTHIPLGATILDGYIDVTTALTSGGAATIAVQVESAGDIVPATAVATWTLGRKKIVPGLTAAADLSAAAVIRTTALRDISIVIAAFALTAGKIKVVLFYQDPLS